jgi:hypothetical protein
LPKNIELEFARLAGCCELYKEGEMVDKSIPFWNNTSLYQESSNIRVFMPQKFEKWTFELHYFPTVTYNVKELLKYKIVKT